MQDNDTYPVYVALDGEWIIGVYTDLDEARRVLEDDGEDDLVVRMFRLNFNEGVERMWIRYRDEIGWNELDD